MTNNQFLGLLAVLVILGLAAAVAVINADRQSGRVRPYYAARRRRLAEQINKERSTRG